LQDCEKAAAFLAKNLPGGKVKILQIANGAHEVYIYQGLVLDATAAAKATTGGPKILGMLDRAGLLPTVESGVFSVQEHIAFMNIIRPGSRLTVVNYVVAP
jgi:hypothetical protein